GWTGASSLPGGDFAYDGLEALIAATQRSWPFLSKDHARRLVRAYGTRAGRILGAAKSLDDLGPRFGSDLNSAEVRYLIKYEWALTAEDVLWRRSKLGLRLSAQETERLARFMAEAVGAGT